MAEQKSYEFHLDMGSLSLSSLRFASDQSSQNIRDEAKRSLRFLDKIAGDWKPSAIPAIVSYRRDA